jgi:hypothetical protein
MENWLARTRLELKVTTDAAFAPTATITPTLSAAGETLTVPLGPDLQDQAIRNAVISFDVHIRDLHPKKLRKQKGRMPDCDPESYTGLPNTEGTFGLADWLTTVAKSAGRDDFASLHEATYDLEFIVLRGAHGGFTFQNANVNANVSGGTIKRTNDNHMVVAFTYDPAPVTTSSGKKRASPGASDRLDVQIQRFLPTIIAPNPGGSVIVR